MIVWVSRSNWDWPGSSTSASFALRVPMRLFSSPMERPLKFQHHQFVGDKRNLVVYDVDNLKNESLIDELMDAGTYLCFGPDTAVEARNRGFQLYQE